MASSLDRKQQQQLQLPNVHGGTTAAPPPTPTTQTNHLSTSAAVDALSNLLHRLPPNLSLPTRRSPSVKSPPIISFSENAHPSLLCSLLSNSSELGFFQLTDHAVPSQLAHSAESESVSLFELPKEMKESTFPKDWPLGFTEDGDEEAGGSGESFCLEASCSSESTELPLACLREFTRAMEKVGLKIVEFLSQAVGFENPVGEDSNRFRSLIWITESSRSTEPSMVGGFYPYIVGLNYLTRNQKYSLLGDSGWTSVAPQTDSILVSIGDIAQVWSNGKLKKVRGKPVAMAMQKAWSPAADSNINSPSISISILITLPIDSQLRPLLLARPKLHNDCDNEIENMACEEEEEKRFQSFSLEEYAWRVYQDRRFLFKDPIHRYRI